MSGPMAHWLCRPSCGGVDRLRREAEIAGPHPTHHGNAPRIDAGMGGCNATLDP